jgi:hypothetical protein
MILVLWDVVCCYSPKPMLLLSTSIGGLASVGPAGALWVRRVAQAQALRASDVSHAMS